MKYKSSFFWLAKKNKENGKKKLENGEPPAVSGEGEDAEAEKEALNKESLGYVQCLNNIDLRVEPGQFLGVAGHIGSGKSSLISAIMGEVCVCHFLFFLNLIMVVFQT